MTERPKEVVFLTSFSEACARALPAVSALAERLDLRLTLLHACDPARASEVAACEALARYFPDADRLEGTRRVTWSGAAIDAVHALHARRSVDLLLAPDLAPARFFSLGASPRAALIAACPAPVWTLGARAAVDVLRRPPQRIACLLHPAARGQGYLHRAARLAADAGAELHVLHVVPDFFEGEIGSESGPLCLEEVADALRTALGPDAAPVVHVSPGGSSGALRELVRGCAPDLLVLGPHDSLRDRFLGTCIHEVADQVECPVLCVGPAVGAPGAAADRDVAGRHRPSRLVEVAARSRG
jgi:nucleotide-binding universal stress UspA family protein